MNRKEIRELKRSIADGRNTSGISTLLERSVRFGHKKLALSRCIQAERMGIAVPPEILAYCQEVADGLAPDILRKIICRTAAQ